MIKNPTSVYVSGGSVIAGNFEGLVLRNSVNLAISNHSDSRF